MDSAENREELAEAAGTYLLAVRAGSVAEVKEEVLARPGRYHQISENLEVKEVDVEGDGRKRRRYFVCRNLKEAERQRRHRESVLWEIRQELERHKAPDATTRWAAELRASKRTGPYLSVTPDGKLRIDPEKVRQKERLDGKWVLITNDETLGSADAASGYKAMMIIEQCFARLKSVQIEVTPVFHWRPRRIEAHVKVCVLALLIQRVAELRVGRPWSRLREDLSLLQATEFRTRHHRFFRTNSLPAAVASILKKLKISPPKQVLAIESATA
jgi:transposase